MVLGAGKNCCEMKPERAKISTRTMKTAEPSHGKSRSGTTERAGLSLSVCAGMPLPLLAVRTDGRRGFRPTARSVQLACGAQANPLHIRLGSAAIEYAPARARAATVFLCAAHNDM